MKHTNPNTHDKSHVCCPLLVIMHGLQLSKLPLALKVGPGQAIIPLSCNNLYPMQKLVALICIVNGLFCGVHCSATSKAAAWTAAAGIEK